MKCCCPHHVSQLRFYTPVRRIPTGRLPPVEVRLSSSGTVSVLRLPAIHPARFTLRFALGYSVVIMFVHDRVMTDSATPGNWFTGSPYVRSILKNCWISQVPMKPLRLFSSRTGSHLRPAPRPRPSVHISPITMCSYCPQVFERQGPRQCVDFGAQSHSPVLRCLRFVPTLRTDYARLAYGWWLAFTVPASTG